MAEQRSKSDGPGVPDGLRTAIERTFAATAEGAAETRERAGAALDEVTRRGRDARESSRGAAGKVIEAIEGMRLATRDEVRELSAQVEALSKRIEKLEAEAKVEG
jgi:polyhydroxyalkanoate synthesis regulator phasin